LFDGLVVDGRDESGGAVARINARSVANTRAAESLRSFLGHEAASGGLLLAAAVLALVWANSPWSAGYWSLWSTEFSIGSGNLALTDDLRHWVNSGLMVLFFFVVGLEIKREVVEGELRTPRAALMPIGGAVGGVLLPVAVFLAIAGDEARRGWGVPMATDIAFVVGVLAILGRRVPAGARAFLLSLAIVDDVIAIVVIAIFYSATIASAWLAAAVGSVVPILLLRRLGVRAIWPYAVLGIVMWYAAYRSGVHATLTGVVLAMLTPVGLFRGRDVAGVLQRWMHPVSAFVVVPLFALANAGVWLGGGALTDAMVSEVSWAVAAGLLAGKTLGITLAVFLLAGTGLGRLPNGLRLRHVWGLAALAGIGFTVSLFIADLAYPEPTLIDQAKIGILLGSVASGIAGAVLLAVVGRDPGGISRRHSVRPKSYRRSAASRSQPAARRVIAR
jgi:Na+:H+ antiporter, NhaA family